MASISGFGQEGPYAAKTAFDMTIAAIGGFMAVNGPVGGPPMKAGPAVSDFVAALYCALSIMAAIRHRDLTGEGQYIDIAMLDSVMSILDASFAVNKLLGTEPTGTGNRRPYYAPVNVFKARDGYVYIAASGQNHWEMLATVMGRKDLIDDPRFTAENRKGNEDELEQIVQDWAKSLTSTEIITLLEQNGVPCAPVKTISEVMDDAHVKARKSIVEFDYPGIGKFPVVAFPPRFSSIATEVKRAPLLGEHNREIICGLLGYGDKQFDEMKAEKVF
jgi:crotonobetainyl-CoA:carnitine CoA-transferase CaiB-like acyl-CoA transferase